MGFDPNKQIFTAEAYKSYEEHRMPIIGEMQPGQVAFIDTKDVKLDGQGDHFVYIYGNVYNDDDVIEVGTEDQDGEIEFARIICIEAGFMIDYSERDQVNWELVSERHNRADAFLVDERPQDYLPVVMSINNEEELEYYSDILYDSYNIDLDDTDLGELIDVIESTHEALAIDEDWDEED